MPSIPPLPLRSPDSLAEKRADLLQIGMLTLGFLLLVTGLYWWQLYSSGDQLRRETLAQAQLRAAQVNSANSQIISMLIHDIDLATEELARHYGQERPESFEYRSQQATRRLPAGSMLQLGVIGADGRLEYSNLGVSERVDLSDREHFKVHLGSGPDRLFISRPVMGRVSKQWSIQFSRPIRRDGKLTGVMVLSVSPDFIRDSLDRLMLASDDSIAIFRQSGELLALNNDYAGQIGQEASLSLPFLAPDAASEGSFNSASEIDQAERIYQWKRLQDYPVTIVLGLSTSTVLKPIERAQGEAIFHAALGTLLLWGSAGIVIILLRRVQVHSQKRFEVEYVALHDALTGLGNRHALVQQLEQELRRARQTGSRFGLLFLDLDKFKPINDRYGHGAGDTVLQAIGARLAGNLRAEDFPARMGGDEFVVIVKRLHDKAEAQALVGRIDAALADPVSVDGEQISVGASIGVALYPEDGQTVADLLESADRVMYQVKRDRKSRNTASH